MSPALDRAFRATARARGTTRAEAARHAFAAYVEATLESDGGAGPGRPVESPTEDQVERPERVAG